MLVSMCCTNMVLQICAHSQIDCRVIAMKPHVVGQAHSSMTLIGCPQAECATRAWHAHRSMTQLVTASPSRKQASGLGSRILHATKALLTPPHSEDMSFDADMSTEDAGIGGGSSCVPIASQEWPDQAPRTCKGCYQGPWQSECAFSDVSGSMHRPSISERHPYRGNSTNVCLISQCALPLAHSTERQKC